MTEATVETRIWRAQRKHLEAFAGLPSVIYPGAAVGTPISRHLRVTTIGAPPDRKYVANGMPHERRGTLQLMYCTPAADFDPNVARQLAGEVAAHFKDGTHMADGAVCLTVTAYPEVADPYQEDGWWKTPIRIRWETEA